MQPRPSAWGQRATYGHLFRCVGSLTGRPSRGLTTGLPLGLQPIGSPSVGRERQRQHALLT